MIFMLIIAVYDFLAVRFGFMVWMADRISQSTSLPAFIFPKQTKDWKLKLETVQFGELKEKAVRGAGIRHTGGRGHRLSADAGGIRVLSVRTWPGALIVGAFALVGLIGAFLIQMSGSRASPCRRCRPSLSFTDRVFIATWLVSL